MELESGGVVPGHAASFGSADRACLAAAAIAVSYAIQIHNGFFTPAALAWVIAAAVLAALALSGWLRRPTGAGRHAVFLVLLAGLAWCFYAHARSRPGMYLAAFGSVKMQFRAMVGLAALFVGLIAFDPARARRFWFPAALASYACLGAWIILDSPDPRIDVFTVYGDGLRALVSGHSPYSITFANIYGHTDFYGTGMVHGSQVLFGFPYPPLALVMALPSVPLGDVRYAQLAAMLVGAAAIGYAGRTRVGLLAAALLLFTPRGLFVIEQAWSEPLVIAWLGVLILAATRGRRTSLALGGLLAVKQHLVLALPFAPWLSNGRDPRAARREVVVALAVAAAVTLPFAAADPSGFWRSVVTLQFAEPFRADSLSVLAALARGGWMVPKSAMTAVPLVAAGAAGWFAWTHAPRTPAGFAATLGFVLVVLFLFSKKAFCNYYFLVLACWCASLAASDPLPESDQGQTRVRLGSD